MNIVNLPYDLLSEEPSSPIILDYRAEKESSKQQVNLSMNTFSFLLEGHKEVYSDTSSVSIANSHFLLMKSGKCLMTEKLTGQENDYRSILLFFSDQDIFDFARKYEVNLEKQASRKSIHAIPYDKFLRSMVEGLIDLEDLSEGTRRKLLKVKFEELMIYLSDLLGTEFLSSLMMDLDDHTHRFLDVVETNKLNKLSLNELAFLSNMSLSSFKRNFEKYFNESPSKWFQDQRLEYSAFLLKNKSQRPSDIFKEVGYDTLSNFIQAFKQKFGITPKQYQLN